MPRVYFKDDDLFVDVKQGDGLMKACGEEGTSIAFGCRRGQCGTCLTTIVQGEENLSKPELCEQMTLKAIEANPGQRLACQVKVFGDITVANPWGKKTTTEQGWFE